MVKVKIYVEGGDGQARLKLDLVSLSETSPQKVLEASEHVFILLSETEYES